LRGFTAINKQINSYEFVLSPEEWRLSPRRQYKRRYYSSIYGNGISVTVLERKDCGAKFNGNVWLSKTDVIDSAK